MKSLTIQEVMEVSQKILRAKDVTRFEPHAIVYIESAGRLIGYSMAEQAGLPLYAVKTVRAGHSLKDRVKSVFNHLPWQVSHMIRKLELATSVHKARGERQVVANDDLPQDKNTRLLVIDDAIDSGVSMKSVLRFLHEQGYHNLFTAVLTTTSRAPVFEADYSHFRELITFPWSIGSKEYDRYKQLYEGLNGKK